MKIFYRIDDRLIHGQVIEGWVHNLNLTRITIVSDRVKEAADYRKMLELSVPPEIVVDIFGVKDMAGKVHTGYLDDEDTIILFESTADVLELLDYGVEIEEINVGCLHYDGTNHQLRSSVALSDADIENLKDINSMGTVIKTFSLPQDKPQDLMEMIREQL